MEVAPATNTSSNSPLFSFENQDRDQVRNAYISLLIDSLQRISALDQSNLNSSGNFLKNETDFSVAQLLLRTQARLNTLRLIENSGKMSSIDEQMDFKEAITENCSNSNGISYSELQKNFICKILSLIGIESLADSKKYDNKVKEMDSKLVCSDETTTEEKMKIDDNNETVENSTPKSIIQFKFTFNCASFLAQLLNYRLYDSKKFDKCTELSMFIINTQNISSTYLEKAFFLFGLSHEKLCTLANHRVFLHQHLSLTTKRMQNNVASVIINIILRNLINEKLYNLADKFTSKIVFPSDAHSDQLARFHFYMGQLRANQAQYSEANRHLTEASRKCPQDSAEEFQLAVYKYLILVTLLLGNMPDKSLYAKRFLLNSMKPYFILTSAVLEGRMGKFNQTVEKYNAKFVKDGTLTLVLRLPSNVLKMALKLICKAYSHISLEDVATRLEIEDYADVQYILQNAIINNVIYAEIQNGVLISKSFDNIYSTAEPTKAFQDRTSFCLNLYEKTRQAIKHLNISDESEDEDQVKGFDFDIINHFSDLAEDL